MCVPLLISNNSRISFHPDVALQFTLILGEPWCFFGSRQQASILNDPYRPLRPLRPMRRPLLPWVSAAAVEAISTICI
jgi:hypothetical protein